MTTAASPAAAIPDPVVASLRAWMQDAETERQQKAAIRRTLELLGQGQPGVVEIRVPEMPARGKPTTASGYYDDLDKAASDAWKLDGNNPSGVYVTLNPVNPALLARCENQYALYAKQTTSDKEIERRIWLYVDCDPARPSGISAADSEQKAALERVHDVEEFLRARGWPDPLLGCSGNGYAAFYKIDLPNDAESKTLIRNVLRALEFNVGPQSIDSSKPWAKVDLTTFNAARIVRLFGTMNRKGSNTKDRPHRRSELFEPSGRQELVAVQQLRELATLAPKETTYSSQKPSANGQVPNGNGKAEFSTLDVARWLRDRGIEFTEKNRLASDGRCVLILGQCPFDASHGAKGDVSVMQAANGRMSFKCFHDSCSGRHWADFKAAVGAPDADHYNPTLRSGKGKKRFDYSEVAATISTAAVDKQLEVPRDGGGAPATASASNTATETDPPPRVLEVIPSHEFATAEYHQRFLVNNILVGDQPAIFGGRSKTMKTSLLTDLAISLGTETSFLGRFPTTHATVAVLSGESGQFTMQETARRIAAAKGIDLAAASVLWGFDLPQIARPSDLAALGDVILANGVEVLIIDPAYLCLLGGDTQGRQASNLFDMGPLLLGLTEIGQATNCTIVLCHHLRKNVAEPLQPPELEDLSMAGFAEWARQWVLLGRRESYEQGSGVHRLWMNVGGSAGHSGCWALDIDEGRLADDFTGRKWDLSLSTTSDAREEQRRLANHRKAEELERKADVHRQNLRTALRKFPAGETGRTLREVAGLSGNAFGPAIGSLIQRGEAVACTIPKGLRQYPGYRPIEP